MTEMRTAELLAQAQGLESSFASTDPRDALLTIIGHGFADEQTGDVQAPWGHVSRVNRWLLIETQERTSMLTLETEAQAIDAFEREASRGCGRW